MKLSPERAKELEQRAKERLNISDTPDSVNKTIQVAAIKAAIVTLQEYERMADEDDSQN